ncbi:MAG: zinc-binding dehydrogenase [Lactobacillus sp.]|nr:zinc-binding dehydrogenase [Lactobacillus sp.]MCI2032891.1 zinc-binding dehydrogenase [Lactobacillus sp.]
MPENIAFAAYAAKPVSAPDCFVPLSLPVPTPGPTDVVVQLEATALNPIDTKRRAALKPQTTPAIFGYDGVGRIVACGQAVTTLAVGQRVMYAGTTQRAGSYQHFQSVPAALVAAAPEDAPAADLAALPLVGLTAWELLFEKMGFIPQANANVGKRLLVVNGAGGVGSMLTQLAHWAGLTVLATASPANFDWLQAHGVDYPLDYHEDLVAAIVPSGQFVDGIALLYAPEPYLEAATTLIAPLGHIATIVTPTTPLPLAGLKPKAASFDQEYMFTKSDYGVAVASTRQILTQLATLYTQGQLTASVTQTWPFTLANLVTATQQLEAGHTRGKLCLLMEA